jgi:RNA polymerase sigma factor (sigma-70 family)
MIDGDSRSDAELLAATPRDPDAFAVFYRRHVRMVLALVARRAEPAEVGDLVAEVFAAALVYRRRYDPARGSGGAWLAGIASHKLAEARRRGAVEARMCRRLSIQRPPLDPLELDDRDAGELLAELPEEQRRAVEARVLHEKPYAQIAREELVSEQAVRKRVSRALRALRSRSQEQQ